MKNITNTQVSFEIFGNAVSREIDFGALTLKRGDKEYIFDAMSSAKGYNDGFTKFNIKVLEDREIFDECNYKLTDVDLFADDLSAEFYIGGEIEPEEIERLRFTFTYGSMVKVINVKLEA